MACSVWTSEVQVNIPFGCGIQLLEWPGYVVRGEVYSLRTGAWRKVEVGNLKDVHDFQNRAFPCNGAIFWIERKEDDVEGHSKSWLYLIVSFDIATEVFTLIPFPPPMASTYRCYTTLSSYENKLAIFGTDTKNSESYRIDLWVLEECAYPSRERWNWAKIYASRPNPFHFIIRPKIIWRNEIVFVVKESPRYQMEGGGEKYKRKFILCNLTTDEFNCFDIPIWSPRLGNSYYVSLGFLDYVESLVLLDNFHI
ncbi:hypothetical protein K1719_002638 [Acacia pycnantha]|nr:hypothetical protein K1719_002638 [Acacia pycnantha]